MHALLERVTPGEWRANEGERTGASPASLWYAAPVAINGRSLSRPCGDGQRQVPSIGLSTAVAPAGRETRQADRRPKGPPPRVVVSANRPDRRERPRQGHHGRRQRPDPKATIFVTGDGAVGSNLAEFECVTNKRLENGFYSGVARALRSDGGDVTAPDQLRTAIEAALAARRPMCIDVRVSFAPIALEKRVPNGGAPFGGVEIDA